MRWRSKATCFSKEVPKRIIATWFPRKTQIAQVELLAIVAAIHRYGPELSGKRVIALVDSESALGAAIKGYSRKDDVSDLLSVLWEEVSRYRIILYLDRISTDANISDGPSRNDWSLQEECDWTKDEIAWPPRVDPNPIDEGLGREGE